VNFFAPDLERGEISVKVRTEIWDSIMKQEFELVHIGNFTYSDLESMAPFERKVMYNNLLEFKKKEKQSYLEAVQAAKARSKSSSSRPRIRRGRR
jgi:hypothetical protein